MKKIVRLTESDLVRLVNRVIKEQSESYNMIKPCASLGVKSPGKCDTIRKMPVESCAKLGLKTVGLCYVDTKKPVPKLPSMNKMNEQVKTLTVGSKGGAMINPGGNRPGHFDFVVKKVLGSNKYMVTISKWEFGSEYAKVGDSGTLTVGNKDATLKINGQVIDQLLMD